MSKAVSYGFQARGMPNRVAGRRDKLFQMGLQAEQKRQQKAIRLKAYQDSMKREEKYERL